MLIQPIDYFLIVWFVLAALSTAYVAWDQLAHGWIKRHVLLSHAPRSRQQALGVYGALIIDQKSAEKEA